MKSTILLALILMSPFSSAFAAEKNELVKTPLTPETTTALKARRDLLRSWAPKCSDGSLTMHNCPFWDAVEYMGMLCLSGETEYCAQVKEAQDPETGRWWRSPEYRKNPKPTDGPTFSRDMDHGVWAYIVATQDKEAMLKYMEYVRGNDYKLCPKSKDGWDACATRATYWSFAATIYDWLGVPRDKKKMTGLKFLIQSVYSPFEAKVVPKTFEMILTAEGVYTIQKMEEKGAKIKNRGTYQRIAEIISRRVPENGFYEYLVHGQNESSAQKILKMCPSTKPVVSRDKDGWEVFTEPANGPWEQGSGHYCIFMINALLGSAL